MENNFDKVREYLTDLRYSIVTEVVEDGIFVIEKEDEGIKNMVVAVAEPIVILEQYLFDIKEDSMEMYKALLQKNQDIIHGAFVIDESGKKVLFRDTLQLENLDLNELEGSLNSLILLLGEWSGQIIKFAS